MDEVAKDARFAHTLKDPRFRKLHVKQKKVKIDSRFKSMLNDKEFTVKTSVDKRGRPVATSSKENFERLYDYESENSGSGEEDDSSESEDNEENKQTSKDEKICSEDSEEGETGDDDEDEGDSEEEDSESEDQLKITEDGPDYARGAGIAESSDEEDDEDDENGLGSEDEGILDHHWNEPDQDAPRTDETTARLALCNMDWDRIKARDLFVLFNSFVPEGGAVQSVTIHLSQIGKEKLAEEDRLGPSEFRQGDAVATDGVESVEMGELNRARLRQYQINRLKYYFAIVVCDSKETAGKVYEECDSLEYEKSSCRIDLRFVPEDMTFDESVKDVCTGISDSASFEPSTFTTTAFCQANVQVTWDETNIDRLKKTMKKFTDEDLDTEEFNELIASSEEDSSEDASDGEERKKKKEKTKKKKKKKGAKSKEKEAMKYRKLLGLDGGDKSKKGKRKSKLGSLDDEDESGDEVQATEISLSGKKTGKKKKDKKKKKKAIAKDVSDEDEDDEDEGEEDEGQEMEFTWETGIDQQKTKSAKAKLTPWEEYQRKKKDKKKEKLKERKRKKLLEQGVEDTTELGFDDPFFNDEPDVDPKKKAGKKERKKGRRRAEEETAEDDNAKKQKAALRLLMDDDHVNHFSLEKILKEEKEQGRRKKGRKRKQGEEEPAVADTFEMNLDKARFSGLFTDPEMHIDPTAPEFKKTKTMTSLMEEVSSTRKNLSSSSQRKKKL